MADKQPQLNGAYYGPAIPPSESPRHRSSHRGRRCCCCLFSFLWKLILAIIGFIVLVFLVFWVVVEPRAFRLHVTDANLKQFNLTTINNVNHLGYNLVLNFTVRNPNKKLNFYYDHVEGHVFYGGVRFASADLVTWRNSFRQYKKSTDSMNGNFTGQHVMVFDQNQVNNFKEEERNGIFHIDVKLYFNIRPRLGDSIGSDTKVRAKCELQVPFKMGLYFPTSCDVKF